MARLFEYFGGTAREQNTQSPRQKYTTAEVRSNTPAHIGIPRDAFSDAPLNTTILYLTVHKLKHSAIVSVSHIHSYSPLRQITTSILATTRRTKKWPPL
jgi:hypothetical protein